MAPNTVILALVVVLLLVAIARGRSASADGMCVITEGRLGTNYNQEPATRRYYSANVEREPWAVTC